MQRKVDQQSSHNVKFIAEEIILSAVLWQQTERTLILKACLSYMTIIPWPVTSINFIQCVKGNKTRHVIHPYNILDGG